MAHWIGICLLLLAAYYGGRMTRYARGWARLVQRAEPEAPVSPPFVSVVIPARNEAARIERCLESIGANAYPPERFEILVVDDGSEDDTAERVQALAGKPPSANPPAPGIRLLRLQTDPQRFSGHKKAAVDRGIRAARGDVILLTDADVETPSTWIGTMVACLDSAADMVAGPVIYAPADSLFAAMQALEFVGFVGIGAGAIGSGRPEICNAANLAFWRSAYEAVGGMDPDSGTTSGDDVWLMHAFETRTPGSVRFCPSREAVVRTAPNPTLRAFLSQRIRWASKSLSLGSRRLALSNLTLVAFDSLLVILTAAAFARPALIPYVLASWGVKAWSVHRLVAPVCRRLAEVRLLRTFWAVTLLQPLYLGLAGILGRFRGYRWKGRRIRR